MREKRRKNMLGKGTGHENIGKRLKKRTKEIDLKNYYWYTNLKLFSKPT